MMAKFRMINIGFWDDPKVVEEMTPEDKYLFLYLLTNANTTQIGIYSITKKQMAFDTGYSMEAVNNIFERLIQRHKLMKYNPKTRELAIRNWGKYNFNRGGKPVEDCVMSELSKVKDRSPNHLNHLCWRACETRPNSRIVRVVRRYGHVAGTRKRRRRRTR